MFIVHSRALVTAAVLFLSRESLPKVRGDREEVCDGRGYGRASVGGGGQGSPGGLGEAKCLPRAPTYTFTWQQTSPSLIPPSDEAIGFRVVAPHIINRHQLDLIIGVRLDSNDRRSDVSLKWDSPGRWISSVMSTCFRARRAEERPSVHPFQPLPQSGVALAQGCNVLRSDAVRTGRAFVALDLSQPVSPGALRPAASRVADSRLLQVKGPQLTATANRIWSLPCRRPSSLTLR